MTTGDAVFPQLQKRARATAAESGIGVPTQQYLIRHALESFLDRLTRTAHADDFVLKGGILLGAYGVRRPPKDIDANAVSADVDAGYLAQVIRDAAVIDAEDGTVFVLDIALTRQGIDPDELLWAAREVARHRGVVLEPVAPHLSGYGAAAQAKWAAWRRRRTSKLCARRVLTNRLRSSQPV